MTLKSGGFPAEVLLESKKECAFKAVVCCQFPFLRLLFSGGVFPLCIEKETINASVGIFNKWKFSLGALGTSEDWHFYNRKELSVDIFCFPNVLKTNFVSKELIFARLGGGGGVIYFRV